MTDTLQSLMARAEAAERCAERLSKLLCKAAKYPDGSPEWEGVAEALNEWAAHRESVKGVD